MTDFWHPTGRVEPPGAPVVDGVSARSSRADPPTPRPLSNWSIAAGALVVLGVAGVVGFVLLRRYGGLGAQIQLDAIRTAGTLVIGTGGAVALLLTARRQRYTELALVHTDRDATERRITELYTKAADQLGSEKAPVRLAGLHALERLAQNTLDQRQTIVDVICAYLRMPYTPPDEQSPADDASTEHRRQEQQVRLTAQNILSRNLRVVAQRRRHWWHRARPAPAWSGIQLNLTGALLLEFSLEECQLDYADFTRAQFTSDASFRGAQFTSGASFKDAQFTSMAFFRGAQFPSVAFFRGAQFTSMAFFEGAQVAGVAFFEGAQFTSGTFFDGAQFTGVAVFEGAQFTSEAVFDGAQFTSGAIFEGARLASVAEPVSVWPPGWTTRPAKPDNGEDSTFLYLIEVEDINPPDT